MFAPLNFPVGLSRRSRSWIIAALAFMWSAAGLAGAVAQPVVGPGATKAEAIEAYGWPTGQSQSGTKEILSYPQGRITLESGRVEKVDFSTNVPWPAPRPRPGPPSPTSVKKAGAVTDFWLQNLEEAQSEATRRHARILALFIGSDWSPPSRLFQAEVAFHPDFVNAFTGDFVFLRLDFPTRVALPPELREQNNRLREKYGVTTYPALLVLSPAGAAVATIDLTKLEPGESYRAGVIAAVRGVRDLLIAQPPPDPLPAPPEPGAGTNTSLPDPGVASFVNSTYYLLLRTIVGGLLLALFGWWFLWRKRNVPRIRPGPSAAERIADAASGLPTPAELEGWSREKLLAVVLSLAEIDGYEARPLVGDDEGSLALTLKGESGVAVIVRCQPAGAGPVSAKRVKELFAVIALEGARTGWFAAPAGFSADARDYARDRQVRLLDGGALIAQMRNLPPISLERIAALR